jgi:DUF2075 family protein
VIIYQETLEGFLRDCFKYDIEDIIAAAFRRQARRMPSQSESRAWRNSLPAMGRIFQDEDFPVDCGVAVEYVITQSAKRVDFLLTGQDAEQRDQLLIVELKQWEAAEKTTMDGIVVTRYGQGPGETRHPSYQAWSYASLLKGFNEMVYEGGIGVNPCAYLHNYGTDGVLSDPFYAEYLELAPIFLKGEDERAKLRKFIRQHVRYGERNKLLYRIESGRIRPSKGLADALTGMLAGKQEFVLIDEQKSVYEIALHLATRANAEQKQVVIVEGGPGTGKSVVAINLLVALNARRLVSKYVTKNSAPRAVFERVLSATHRKTQIANLFASSGEFMETSANAFDVLVVDEAHRLNEKTGPFLEGENQIMEIIGSAKCSIFFIDEDQRVTWKDIGETAEIERRARIAGASVTKLSLASQFRCSGSNGYLAWLDDTLGIRETANPELEARDFDFRVFDSPEVLRREIVELNKTKNKARMVAGYCWDWSSKNNTQALDVVIPEHGFAMQWNLTKDGGLWIMASESVKEIGCIHTCQGLEVDYIGVIIGPDFVVRDGNVVTHPEKRSRQDQSIKGYKKLYRTDPAAATKKADIIIKNTYRTLMTRGMKGCYVYCTDAETREYLRERSKGRLVAP